MIQINGYKFDIKVFPDGTLNMTDLNIPGIFDTICIDWCFENLIEQVVLQNLVHYFKDVHCQPVVLYLPYVPNARMDRVKNSYREIHTLKYFCKFINDLGFDKVYVRDVHSPVTMTLLDRAEEYTAKQYVQPLIDDLAIDFLFFPDKGAMQRYDYLTTRTPFFGNKVRDWNNGKILSYAVENPFNITGENYLGRSILIVDDICSYGTTFLNAADALKKMGFGDIYLYITHAENSILKGKLIDDPNICHIYTTKSILTQRHPKITVIE